MLWYWAWKHRKKLWDTLLRNHCNLIRQPSCFSIETVLRIFEKGRGFFWDLWRGYVGVYNIIFNYRGIGSSRRFKSNVSISIDFKCAAVAQNCCGSLARRFRSGSHYCTALVGVLRVFGDYDKNFGKKILGLLWYARWPNVYSFPNYDIRKLVHENRPACNGNLSVGLGLI